MSTSTSTQSSDVSTEDTPRARDVDVVTTETPGLEVNAKPAAADPAQTPDASAAPDSDKKPDDSDRPSGRRVERRIRNLTRKIATLAAEKEAEAKEREKLERELEELRAKVPAAAKPKLSEFDDEDAFAEAYEAWKTASEKPAPKKREAPPAPPPLDPDQLRAFHQAGTERIGDAFLAAMKDQDLQLNAVMSEYLIEAEAGPELYVYLSEHKDEARELCDETPVEVVKRFQEIERELSGKKKKPAATETAKPAKPAKGRTTTAAPPPGPDPDAGAGGMETPLEGLSMEDYAARRRAMLKKRNHR